MKLDWRRRDVAAPHRGPPAEARPEGGRRSPLASRHRHHRGVRPWQLQTAPFAVSTHVRSPQGGGGRFGGRTSGLDIRPSIQPAASRIMQSSRREPGSSCGYDC
eukprot:scaffold3743_cov389-Prasinococcus_capsulatus_cf.AAC.14